MDAHALVGATLRELSGDALAAIHGVATDAPHENPAEAVHDLRVALRRLRSGLKPVRPLYGKGVVGATEEALRDTLLLTSDLRDEEVLRETLGDLTLGSDARRHLDVWMKGRARREQGLRARTTAHLRHALASPDGVVAAVTLFDRRVAVGARRQIDARAFLVASIHDAVGVLEERAESASIGDGAAMHKVRISSKKLRYTAALLAAHLGDREHPLAAAAPHLAAIEKASTKIQKRLGQLHDADEARARMGRAWGLDRARRVEILEALEGLRAKIATMSATDLHHDRSKIRAAVARISEEVGSEDRR